MDASQILPRLWLGNFDNSQDANFIQSNRITVVVNCTKELPFLDLPGIYKYRVPVHDNLKSEEIIAMSQWIDRILPILAIHYRQGRGILIHCAMGIQRSAIVMLSFLYRCCGYDPKTALIKMRIRRPIVFQPYMNFSHSFLLAFGSTPYRELIKPT